MSQNVVKLKLDVIFKKAFLEHDDLLQGLLSELLQVNLIRKINIRNSEILPDNIGGRFVRMDLNLEADGRLINVEIQYRYDPDYKDRALFHWSKLYGGELKSGNDYKDLKPSICINIINHNIFDCAEYHSYFTVMEKNRLETLTDKCAIHFFELKKIGKTINKDDKMRLWLQLINAETEEELTMLEQTGVEPIQNAVKVIRDMSEDTKTREIARMREKALLDETSAMNNSKREGIQEGIQEGIEIAAQSMRNSGMSEDEIKRILRL